MMKKKILLGAAALAVLSAPVLADEMKSKPGKWAPASRAEVEAQVKERFARHDANGDGAVTREELDAGREKMMAEARARHFDTMDADRNGAISRAEFDAAHDTRKARMAERRGGEGGHGGHGGKHHRGMKGEGRMLDRQDANKDGKVTLAEATAAALARFDAVDADRDGKISDAERKAHREKMRSEWRAKRDQAL